ncbi:hypothetical protein [Arthrobacter sp. BE255]|uniref:hypothetical protein n=1 Tax=Arthrobacter sp. BE255 TaxID=2817721 RepID=UPI00286315ED|nr:hypothetical protein [Arthrobacter sp. BE255]MDR7158185.1 hypothetical protein [Arthrobacter sp. BE255]
MPSLDFSGVFTPVLSGPANIIDAMERLDIDDNCPPLVVLDGQTSIEELFDELGFEWRADSGLSGTDVGAPSGGMTGQATLF